MGTILEVFQKIVTFDLRAAQGENVGTVFLERGTARMKTQKLDCCSLCSRNWRAGGRAAAECAREKRGSERGQKQLKKRERTWLGPHRQLYGWEHLGLFFVICQWQ